MFLPNPLNVTDTENTGPLNKYAREVNTSLEQIQGELKRQNTAITKASAAAAAAGATSGGSSMALAADVTGVSASENGYIVDGVLFSEVTCTYTAPNPLGTFAGVFLVIQNYRGSSELVKVTEHHYAGAGGGTAHFKVTLQRTGETVTLYFVATNSESATVANWATEPNTTAVLDGNASAPTAPASFSGTAQQLGVLLTWAENIENNMKSYNVYRNVVNNPSTANNIATVVANGLGTGSATYFDKSTLLGTTYFYWVTAIDNAQLESTKAGPVSLTANTVLLESEVVDGPTRGAITAANTSYRPLTNPLTARDNGVSAEIDIASFTMRVANGHDVSINSGVVSGLLYNTTYHVYYDDPSYAGGAVTYFVNIDQAIALSATGRFYVGSILTPVAGGAVTTGNNDGGTGAQSGQLYLISPSLRADDSTDPVSWYPANDLDSDGDTSSFVAITTTLISWLGGWPQITSKWKSLKLKVHSAVVSVTQGGTAFVDYSLDDGTTWTNIYSVVNGTDDSESASAGANDGGAGTAWTNPSNVAAPDNYATIVGAAHGSLSQGDNATGFGFAIPVGSTVLGITAKCDEVIGGSATEQPQLVFQLLKAGTPVGNTRTVNAPPTSTVAAGANTDLWGAAWTDADINNANFGVSIRASAPTPASTWVSNTYYSPLGIVIDSNGNLQQIVTPGITGATVTWATGLNATTSDGTVTWKLIQLAASLTWAANTTYAPGTFIVASVSGVNHVFQLDSAGPKMPRLASGCHAYVWSGSSGAGTSSGAFNKTFPQGSAPGGFNPSSLHWDNPAFPTDVTYYDISGNGTVGATHDTGFYENWQAAVVGSLYFPVAGQYKFRVQQDDGMLIGFQSGITKVAGSVTNPRGQTRTAKQGYTIIAGVNSGGSYTTFLTINVPTAGTWGFEIDYSNWEHRGTMILAAQASDGNYYDIIAQATTLKSGASAPTWPTWSTSFAPSYPSAVESAGNYVWFNRGPATDFSWQALTSFTAAGLVVIDSNLNGEVAYRAGLSSAGAQPTWAVVLNTLTTDNASLLWKNIGSVSVSTTFNFSIRNAVIQVTYVAPGAPSSRAKTTDSITIPITQNLGRVQVRYGFVTQAGEQDLYEVWIEAQAG